MFTIRQKLLIIGVIVFTVLIVAGSYFGRHWLFGPDVEPVPEHLLTDEPRSVRMNRLVRASVSQDTSSVSGTDTEEALGDDVVSTINTDELGDDGLADLVDALDAVEKDEESSPVATGGFPEVPDEFPFTPVWLEYPNYEKGDKHQHELIARVLIKLWNQGDHDFVNGAYENGKVYPLYNDVMYVEWDTHVMDGPDGPIEFKYITSALGTHARDDIEENNLVSGGLFTIEEMITGAYKTKYPDLQLVDYGSAGYDPATFLDDY